MSKLDRPETMHQARRWQAVKDRYVKHGLCHACAGQAAYGHQLGFKHSRPPCAECAPIVASFPEPTTHQGWQKLATSARLGTPEGDGTTDPETLSRIAHWIDTGHKDGHMEGDPRMDVPEVDNPLDARVWFDPVVAEELAWTRGGAA